MPVFQKNTTNETSSTFFWTFRSYRYYLRFLVGNPIISTQKRMMPMRFLMCFKCFIKVTYWPYTMPLTFPQNVTPTMTKVKSGYLWIIIVHMNYTNEVNEVAVKTGSLPSGNTVNCKLMDVEAEFWRIWRIWCCRVSLGWWVEFFVGAQKQGEFAAPKKKQQVFDGWGVQT